MGATKLIVIVYVCLVIVLCLAGENGNNGDGKNHVNAGYCVAPLVNDANNKQHDCNLSSSKAHIVSGESEAEDIGDSNHTPRDYTKWQSVEAGRFRYLVALVNSTGHVVCGGVLIRPGYVLSAEHCIWLVGPNPIVALGFTGLDGKGNVIATQMRRVESVHRHPQHPEKWNAHPTVGVDAVLLKLPYGVGLDDKHLPVTAAPTYDARTSKTLVGFRLGLPQPCTGNRTVEVAIFKAAVTDACHETPEKAKHILCVHSASATIPAGSSGFPMVYMDYVPGPDGAQLDPIREGVDDLDLVVAAVSYTTSLGGLDTTGTVRVMDIVGWIDEVTAATCISPRACTVWIALTAILMAVVFGMMVFILIRRNVVMTGAAARYELVRGPRSIVKILMAGSYK